MPLVGEGPRLKASKIWAALPDGHFYASTTFRSAVLPNSLIFFGLSRGPQAFLPIYSLIHLIIVFPSWVHCSFRDLERFTDENVQIVLIQPVSPIVLVTVHMRHKHTFVEQAEKTIMCHFPLCCAGPSLACCLMGALLLLRSTLCFVVESTPAGSFPELQCQQAFASVEGDGEVIERTRVFLSFTCCFSGQWLCFLPGSRSCQRAVPQCSQLL